jgi:hypothetical protein
MPMLMNRRIASVIGGLGVALVLCAVLLVTSLLWPDAQRDLPKPTDGNPVLTHADPPDHMLALINGRFELVDGCLLMGGQPVIWPPDTTWDDTQQAVMLTYEGKDLVLHPGEELPGLGGGVLSSVEYGEYLHPDTIARARACADDDILVIVN